LNYRHHYHAGNFADVFKHAILLQLVEAMQRKEKGFLYLDTHAGRGRYELSTAAHGTSLARLPEWPDGIGRIWHTLHVSEPLASYLGAVRAFDTAGATGIAPVFYPGSPRLVQARLRPQDRMLLCEKHEEEAELLREEFRGNRRVSVQAADGYQAVKASLPCPERRALVLIDPPYESGREISDILTAVEEGLRRMPSVTLAIWYPLTSRAKVDLFAAGLIDRNPPPCFMVECSVAGENSALKMRGSGLAVINPPWQSAPALEALARELSDLLAQESGNEGRLRWLVEEN
jgi:23S rRNA (adenine2030-N6)-methyltransferase